MKTLKILAKSGNRFIVSANAPCLKAFVTRPIQKWNFPVQQKSELTLILPSSGFLTVPT
jgi:hypothetical protein